MPDMLERVKDERFDIVVIDGMNLVIRSMYGLDGLCDSKDRPTNIIYGVYKKIPDNWWRDPVSEVWDLNKVPSLPPGRAS